MSIYFDPSVLVAIYLPEARTPSLRAWLAETGCAVGLNVWQELEFKNSARQKVLRAEAAEGDLARALRVFEDDCVQGRIVRRAVPWEPVFAEGERLSRKLAIRQSCRAFDLIHVAVAVVSGLRDFVTLDVGQAALATAAGLEVIELPPCSAPRRRPA
jgi:predicted nucleic acid-binding protein